MTDVTLGGYPAKTCARAVHNDHTPGLGRPETPPALAQLFGEGKLFEVEVTDALNSLYGEVGRELLVMVERGLKDWDRNIAATIEAMHRGAPVIVNGRLPNTNGRSGAPDVLLRHGGGYLPVDIKMHGTLTKQSTAANPASKVQVSALLSPLERVEHIGRSNKGGHWQDDVLQLAHYTRMLQDLELHPGSHHLTGGIIGTTEFGEILGEQYGIAWYDLAKEDWQTYSASGARNRKNRSAMDRYDHEFAFRQKVAAAARAGDALVVPYRIKDCDQCLWFEHCQATVGLDDASFSITIGQLTVREWQHLYPDSGRLTVHELAEVDIDSVVDGFTPQSTGTAAAATRLQNAVRRARMARDDVAIEPIDGETWPIPPTADVEIDFDIEWDRVGRIYQWGLRVRHGQDEATAHYEPDLVRFEVLDEAGEAELADRFADALHRLVADAEASGESLAIFHWTNPEVTRTAKFTRIAELLDGRAIDLNAWFNQHLFGRHGSSLKPVAQTLGFSWAVGDPGGLVSMDKIELARGTSPEAEEARQWCLDYNESDVAAQAAIRDALRQVSSA